MHQAAEAGRREWLRQEVRARIGLAAFQQPAFEISGDIERSHFRVFQPELLRQIIAVHLRQPDVCYQEMDRGGMFPAHFDR